MKNIQKLSVILVSAIIPLLLCLYIFFLFGLPKLLTGNKNITKYEQILKNKTSLNIKIKGLDVKTYPNLHFEISTPGIYLITKEQEKPIIIDNFSYKGAIYNVKHGNLDTDYVYVDFQELKKYIKPQKKETKLPKFNFFPVVNIKRAYFKIDNGSDINFNYIRSQQKKNKIYTKLFATIKTNIAKYPVEIGQEGEIIYSDKIEFDNFSVKLQNSKMYFSGNKNEIKMFAQGLPADEMAKNFLFFYKLKHPDKKNFIENFSNFRGTLDVDLTVKNGDFYGKCITNNLGALFSNFKIDVFLPKTVFYFDKKEVSAVTQGTFGTEPVETDFYLKGIATDDLYVNGNVHSVLTNNFTKKYFPILQIRGKADAKVTYKTHNQTVDVFYTLKVDKNNDILSSFGNLSNTDKKRVLSMHTKKQGDPIAIKDYDYSIYNGEKQNKLLYGDGNFEKINKTYTLAKINLKTNGTIPFTYIQSFLKNYLTNGTFNADLQYDNLQHIVYGNLNLYDVTRSNFMRLKKTNINIDKKQIQFKTNGSFFGSQLSITANADNNINKNIKIHDIAVHLDKFHLHSVKIPKTTTKKNKTETTTPNVTVENGSIIVDKIYSDKFEVYNTKILGSLKNNTVNFIMPKADYAKGLLSAKGEYNVKNHSSNINFYASDIDSNDVVTNFFKLPNFAQGQAFATLHVITKNKLNDVKANATFAITNGHLPQLGNKEFHLGRSTSNAKARKNKTFTLAKITNIDFSKRNKINSNLFGTFKLDNNEVKDVKIFSKNEYLGLFIEGLYDIDTQNGTLCIWGKRNKTKVKKIRVFKIPINLLYKFVFRPEHTMLLYQNKVSQIPDIGASFGDEISIFRVYISGKLNSKDKIKIELRDLR